MNFNPNYPIADLKPADYNPRKISPEAFSILKDSISRFGMVKPIILNGTGILTAGHQRIKACKSIGVKDVPAILLKNISLHDEIKFNLFHNSIETNKSEAKVKEVIDLCFGYSFVNADDYECGENKNAPVVKHIADLYLRYGNWGSVVCDEAGKIILNSDYAIAMKMYNEPILVYKLHQNDVKDFLDLINHDYGEYHFEALQIKPYVQYHCQMNRIKTDEEESHRSTLYERYVLYAINKDQRIIDFGAGKFAYMNFLQRKGFKIFGYEPFFKKNNHEILISKVVKDIDTIRRDIILNKLYDVVILDSVINSITSLEYENYVLATCNALMKAEGVLYLATRCLESVEKREKLTKATIKSRIIEFLDKDNFSATFRQGNWTLQRFHSVNSLGELLNKYFAQVEIIPGNSQNYAICRLPKQLSIAEYETALNTEFNMEYPNNFKHNRHEALVKYLLDLVRERNVSSN